MQFEFGDQAITVNMPTQDALFADIRRRFRTGQGFALATVNLDHLVKLFRDAAFLRAYAMQDLVVADGRPIVWLSRLARRPVEVLPGSDLVHPLSALAVSEGIKVSLVGSSEQALAYARRVLETSHPGLQIALCQAPEFGFDPDSAAADNIFAQLVQQDIGLCFVALGAPKQERFAARGRSKAPGVGFASVGAGLDFLGGAQRRAPRWVRALALEWLWRALRSPVRLGPRYVRCLMILPGQVIHALRQRQGSEPK